MLRFCAFVLSMEQKPANLYKNIGKIKGPLDNLFGKENGGGVKGCEEEKSRR